MPKILVLHTVVVRFIATYLTLSEFIALHGTAGVLALHVDFFCEF